MDIVQIVLVIVVILFSMTLHELMHGLIAYRLGDDTPRLMGRLTFNPLKHIDPFLTLGLPVMIVIMSSLTGSALPIFGGAKPVPFAPNKVKYEEWGVALVAISGPLVNLVLAFISYGLLALINYDSGSLVAEILQISVMVNLGFFVFNILPIPPLDGSRVLYSVAPDPIRLLMDQIERFGLVLVFLLVFMMSSFLSTYMSGVTHFFLVLFSHIFGA